MIQKLKNLALSNSDWRLIELLIKVLAPLFKATQMLQGLKYQTFAISKVIENLLIKYYETLSKESKDAYEIALSDILIRNLQHYLIEKTSIKQKKLSLVNFKIVNGFKFSYILLN